MFNHNYGEAQIPALVAQKETYRGFYFGDTWRVTQKLTFNVRSFVTICREISRSAMTFLATGIRLPSTAR